MTVLAQFPLADAQQHGEACIGKAFALEAEHTVAVDIQQRHRLQGILGGDDVFDLHQEPGVHAGVLVHLVHRHPGAEGVTDVPDAVSARVGQLRHQLFAQVRVIHVDLVFKAGRAHFQPAQGFLQ